MNGQAFFDMSRWLAREKGILPNEIVIFGYSIGTGAAAQIAKEMEDAGTPLAGLILYVLKFAIFIIIFRWKNSLKTWFALVSDNILVSRHHMTKFPASN